MMLAAEFLVEHGEMMMMSTVADEMGDATQVVAVALVDIADVGKCDRVVEVVDDSMVLGDEIADDGAEAEAVDDDGVDQRVVHDAGEAGDEMYTAVVLEEALQKTNRTMDWVSDLDDSFFALKD